MLVFDTVYTGVGVPGLGLSPNHQIGQDREPLL